MSSSLYKTLDNDYKIIYTSIHNLSTEPAQRNPKRAAPAAGDEMMAEATERFHQRTAANGRDLNTVLSESDITVIAEALSRYINLMHSEACVKGMTAHKDSEAKKWHDRYNEQYERACVAYHRITGKSAVI